MASGLIGGVHRWFAGRRAEAGPTHDAAPQASRQPIPGATRAGARAEAVPVNFQPRGTDQIDYDVGYAIQQATYLLSLIRQLDLDPATATALELGPGVNFGHSLILASHGMWMTLADRFLTPWNPGYHPVAYRALAEAWDGPDAALVKALNSGGHAGALGLVGQSAEALTSLADNSFDLVFSNAVLEHVYDMAAVAREMARVTRPGGYNSHQIDFRDHHDFDHPLEFLLIEDKPYAKAREMDHWERGNRIRVDEAAHLFADAGFEIVSIDVNDRAQPDYLTDFIPRLRATGGHFAATSDEDLATTGARLLLRKP